MKLKITEAQDAQADKISLRVDIIVAVIFAVPFIVPFFTVLPEWYITTEVVFGFIIIGFTVISTGVLSLLLALNKYPNTKQPYFTGKRYIAWAFGALVATSMFVQEMDNLFSVYLIMTLAFHVVSYMWMKKTA